MGFDMWIRKPTDEESEQFFGLCRDREINRTILKRTFWERLKRAWRAFKETD